MLFSALRFLSPICWAARALMTYSPWLNLALMESLVLVPPRAIPGISFSDPEIRPDSRLVTAEPSPVEPKVSRNPLNDVIHSESGSMVV